MKQYLFDTFQFNDRMNRQMMEKIKSLPNQDECVRQFSHLINSQKKWMARIQQVPGNSEMSWWEPLYPIQELAEEWQLSLQQWLKLIDSKSESELLHEVEFTGYDGGRWSARLLDIALQLNYHSIHHRAQMQVEIRRQGVEPDFIDYIGTKYKKLA